MVLRSTHLTVQCMKRPKLLKRVMKKFHMLKSVRVMVMIWKISDVIFRQIKRAGFQGELDEEALMYGIKILVSSALSIIISLIIGGLFHRVFGIIVYLTTYIALRSQTNGIHLSSYDRCCFVFQLIIICVVKLEKIICKQNPILICLFLILSSCVIPLVPVETKNNPMPQSMKKQKKKKSIRINIIIILFLILGNSHSVTYYIAMAGIINHVLVIIAKIAGGNSNEEKQR